MFPRYQDYNLQGDGSLLIVRQSAREGRSKRTRRCIPAGFSSFFETKRVAIGGIWLVVFGSSASQAKDHLVTGSLKVFEQPGLSESILGASWSATGAKHPPKGPITHSWGATCTTAHQVLHQSNTHPPPAPQHQPPPKNNTKDKAKTHISHS